MDPEGKFSDKYLNDVLENCGYNLKEKLKIGKNDKILDFLVDKSGENLSQGEKQIINFLRVLVRNDDFICLDEATSNVDLNTGYF